jgi:uncharacterized membrane protein
MAFEDVSSDSLPDPIRTTIKSIGRIHAEHHEGASSSHKLARLITVTLGNPLVLGIVILAIVGWVLLNLALDFFGGRPPDPPPFQWLELFVSIGSLLVVFVVLATQQRDEELTQLNQRLTLQLAILAEQKAAKTIELLERLRKDHPAIPDRHDEQAHAMAQPTNPEAVLNAINRRAVERIRDTYVRVPHFFFH